MVSVRRVDEWGGGGRRRILGEMRIVKISRAEEGRGRKTGKEKVKRRGEVEGKRKRIGKKEGREGEEEREKKGREREGKREKKLNGKRKGNRTRTEIYTGKGREPEGKFEQKGTENSKYNVDWT